MEWSGKQMTMPLGEVDAYCPLAVYCTHMLC